MHVFFHAIEEEEKKNAGKSIPENVFCFCDRCYYGSFLILAGFFYALGKKLDKLMDVSYTAANGF